MRLPIVNDPSIAEVHTTLMAWNKLPSSKKDVITINDRYRVRTAKGKKVHLKDQRVKPIEHLKKLKGLDTIPVHPLLFTFEPLIKKEKK